MMMLQPQVNMIRDDCDKMLMDNTVQNKFSPCINCNAGKYVSGNSSSDHASESNCKICHYSRYSYQGYGSCSWCDAGKFIDDNAATISEHDNQNDCGVCSEGKYRETERSKYMQKLSCWNIQ